MKYICVMRKILTWRVHHTVDVHMIFLSLRYNIMSLTS